MPLLAVLQHAKLAEAEGKECPAIPKIRNALPVEYSNGRVR